MSPICSGATNCSSPDGSVVGVAVTAALQFFAASQCLVQEPWPMDTPVPNLSSFDFIIVGAGTAGSTLAARLVEERSFSVLLLEAGGDPPQESIIPGFRDSLKESVYDWKFKTQNDTFSSQAFQDGSQKQPRGKMLGGTGSMNDMVYARGFPEDYTEWASVMGEEWNWTNVLKYFMKSEKLTDEKIIKNTTLNKLHGTNGEIEVSGNGDLTYTSAKFLEAFGELGFHIVNDMTNPDIIGAGRFSHTIRKGTRDGSLISLLNKVSKNKNLFVMKNITVTKIVVNNNTTYGVNAIFNGQEHNFFAKKEVIVSAGTFNTPKLLLLSGIGPQEHLNEVGVKIIRDMPYVGENLHDHVMVLTFLQVDNGMCQENISNSYLNMIQYLYNKSGPLSYSDSIGAYIALDALKPNVPDFAIYPTCLPVGSNFYEKCINILGFEEKICLKLDRINREKDIIILAVVLLKPKSRGKVKLATNDYLDRPLIYSGTFSDLKDLEQFTKVMDIAWSLTQTSIFRNKTAKVISLEVNECKGLKGPEAKTCLIRSTATSAWHSVGTAAMNTVVDGMLKVKGLNNLRIVDASVMPKIIRGNTNAPVIMIAEKAADFIKNEYRMT